MSARGVLWAVMGPTATGKSALALDLCDLVGGEIVTVDSAQVFRRLDVGTAKPDATDRARHPHHLIDVIEPTEQWSAAEFAAHADAVIDDVRARGKVPILCGGTGLWMRALVRGIFEAPDIDPDLRAQIRADLEARGPEALHAELAAVDPAAAAKIQPRDPQRIGRALEVFRQTGVPISTLQAKHAFADARYDLVGISLAWPRDALAARIATRTARMYAGGLVEETEAALSAGVPPDAPGLSIIGYRDAVALVTGEVGHDEAVRRTEVATRRYAKRQRNWFNQEPEVHPMPPETTAAEARAELEARTQAVSSESGLS